MASTLGKVNPFRYRGYVYDEETELYYLRSRYYAFNFCRFLNVDMFAGKQRLLSHNACAYTRNNVISSLDNDGFEDVPLPQPTRPEGWDKEFRIMEQQWFEEQEEKKAAKERVDRELFTEALRILECGSGEIITKTGIYRFQTSKSYDREFRQDASSITSVLAPIFGEGIAQGVPALAKKSSCFAKLNPYVSIAGHTSFVIGVVNSANNAYISHFLDKEGTIGVVTYVHYDGSVGWSKPWTEETIPNMYGEILGVMITE